MSVGSITVPNITEIVMLSRTDYRDAILSAYAVCSRSIDLKRYDEAATAAIAIMCHASELENMSVDPSPDDYMIEWPKIEQDEDEANRDHHNLNVRLDCFRRDLRYYLHSLCQCQWQSWDDVRNAAEDIAVHATDRRNSTIPRFRDARFAQAYRAVQRMVSLQRAEFAAEREHLV